MNADPVAEFRAGMLAAGIPYTGPLVGDGLAHRFKADGDKSAATGYVLHLDGLAAGSFWCFRRGIEPTSWHATPQGAPDVASLLELRKQWRLKALEETQKKLVRQATAAQQAAQLLRDSLPAPPQHPYLQRKACGGHGALRADAQGHLLLPLTDPEGVLCSLQTIDAEGDKLFLPQGRTAGACFWVDRRVDGPLILCEGYATGASLFEATGWAVCCALTCGNLLAVAQALRRLFPQRTLIVAADNDERLLASNLPPSQRQRGVYHAHQAAEAVHAKLIVPEDFSELDATSTDFNDLAHLAGLPAVAAWFNNLFDSPTDQHWPVPTLLALRRQDSKDNLIGLKDGLPTGFLCRGQAAWLIGGTGLGKSVLALQQAVCWALGLPFFGIQPLFPLRILHVQNENDQVDLAESLQGICRALQLSPPQLEQLHARLHIRRLVGKSGPAFITWLRERCACFHPDFIQVDPMLRYGGKALFQPDETTTFLNDQLAPFLADSGTAFQGVHHPPKPKPARDTKDQSSYDLAYAGTGVADLANWARAIFILQSLPATQAVFKFSCVKRFQRAGLTHPDGSPTDAVFLRQGSPAEGIAWFQLPLDDPRFPIPSSPPSKITRITSANLHDFLARCPMPPLPPESLRAITRRLEDYLAANLLLDASLTTCRSAIIRLVEIGKLSKLPGSLYTKGPNA